MEQQKRRIGDRRDGKLLRELDSLHFITGIIYPNRCDNEAYISERVDLTAINAYLARKNEKETDFPYTMFHLMLNYHQNKQYEYQMKEKLVQQQ